jgi:general secretion pathway protein E
VRLGALSEDDLLSALSTQLGLKVQSAADMPSLAQTEAFMAETGVQHAWWVERQAVAWKLEGPSGALVCAAVDPLDPAVRGLVEQFAEGLVEWRLASRAVIATALEDVRDVSATASYAGGEADAQRLRELAQEAPVIDFVNALFAEALRRRASDIHVEPFEDRFFVRMRVDGMLHTVRTAPRTSFDAVCSRLKLLSGMDIADRRLPQDGRQAVRISGQEVDLRVSSLPATWGESMVLRLLGKASRLPELSELGLANADGEKLSRLVAQPNGIVLITGPTGSGKTTTIYRLLSALNDGERKIVTVEDPVEFDLPGVIQVQTKSDIGLTFAAGLRSILRQDPDVIMVGEIRDSETARIALQAALTGHMVISTVHTNSAFAAISRLLDLGVEDYLLADVMRGVCGQRLVRRLCPHCSRPATAARVRQFRRSIPDTLQARMSAVAENWREPVGCVHCSGGYINRMGVYEVSALSPALSAAIRGRTAESELLRMARADGFITMFEDGVLKAAEGATSLREIYRVIGATDPEMRAHDADEAEDALQPVA